MIISSIGCVITDMDITENRLKQISDKLITVSAYP